MCSEHQQDSLLICTPMNNCDCSVMQPRLFPGRSSETIVITSIIIVFIPVTLLSLEIYRNGSKVLLAYLVLHSSWSQSRECIDSDSRLEFFISRWVPTFSNPSARRLPCTLRTFFSVYIFDVCRSRLTRASALRKNTSPPFYWYTEIRKLPTYTIKNSRGTSLTARAADLQ